MGNNNTYGSNDYLSIANNSNSENSFGDAYNKFFPSEQININREPSEEYDSQIYFNTDNYKTTKEETKEKNKIDKNVKFNISKSSNNSINLVGKKTKRGRKKKAEKKDNNGQFSKKCHTKYCESNVLHKIKTDSINSIIDTANSILEYYKCNERFKYIDASYKKNVNKNEIELIKTQKLSDIILLPISPKYKNSEKDYNKQLYNKLKENPKYKVLKSFLDETYLHFFQDIYYQDERNINLKKYGINDYLPLSKKVKLSIDKINSFDANEKDYLKLYNQCINKNYFDDKLKFYLE